MLYMRVKVHSPTPPPGRCSQGRLTESIGTTHIGSFNGEVSKLESFNLGFVQQGSGLGPTLFLAFSTELEYIVWK